MTGFAFSPDGKLLLTSSWDGTSRLWDVTSGKELRVFLGHTGTVFGAAFSPDGKYILTSSADQTARLWDIQTGQKLRRFAGHTDEIRFATFSPDGKYILTAPVRMGSHGYGWSIFKTHPCNLCGVDR